MELTIQLPDELIGQLRREAERRGLEPQRYAAQIIQQHFPVANGADSLRELFSRWEAEDATTDPQEIARRQEEWEQLKRSLDANRTSGRKLFGNDPQ